MLLLPFLRLRRMWMTILIPLVCQRQGSMRMPRMCADDCRGMCRSMLLMSMRHVCGHW